MGFFIPLFFMFFLYIRIFSIIKKHQAQRSIGQRSRSIRSSPGHTSLSERTSSPFLARHNTSPNKAFTSNPSLSQQNRVRKQLPHASQSVGELDQNADKNVEARFNISPINLLIRRQQVRQNNRRFSSLIVTRRPKDATTKTEVLKETQPTRVGFSSFCAFFRCQKKAPTSPAVVDGKPSPSNSILSLNSMTTIAPATAESMSTTHPGFSYGTQINPNTEHLQESMAESVDTPIPSCNKGHAKALVTTLLILGTYVLCWIPAVLFFALTCIDYCPYPINYVNFRDRIIIGFTVNGLVILKAIIDPFIYTYRMKEMKTALNRYVRLPFMTKSGDTTTKSTLSASACFKR